MENNKHNTIRKQKMPEIFAFSGAKRGFIAGQSNYRAFILVLFY